MAKRAKKPKAEENIPTQVSSLPKDMKPHTIHNISNPTNMFEVSWEEFTRDLYAFIACVRTQAMVLYEDRKTDMNSSVGQWRVMPAAAEYARQQGINYDITVIPSRVKQKSRINRLIRHKIVTETASYLRQPDENKSEHRFGPTVNLGAADKQMCTLSWDKETNLLVLEWACWENTYLLTFLLPSYVLSERDVLTWSLPVVSPKGFKWAYEERVAPLPVSRPVFAAATDYGRVDAYTTIIVNGRGGVVGEHHSSGRLRLVNTRRENILKHKGDNQNRLREYERRDPDGLDPVVQGKAAVLKEENKRLGAKASRLLGTIANQSGHEINEVLARHRVGVHYTEDLSWAAGAVYGSKFGHSRMYEATEHALTRKGIRHLPVSAKNNSQDCYLCETKVIHNSRTRMTRCPECNSVVQRDRLACLNMLRKKGWLPVPLRRNEPTRQVSVEQAEMLVTSVVFNSS